MNTFYIEPGSSGENGYVESFNGKLRNELLKGMLEKAEQGIWPSCAPLGYINVERNGRRYIESDPETAPTIKKLFECYSTRSYSIKALTSMVGEEGLTYRKSGARFTKARFIRF